MSKSTHIWWDESWNPVTGCTPKSAGCANCYAKTMAETRLRGKFGYPADKPFRVTVHPEQFDKPLHWEKPRRIFVCSMGDLFHRDVPIDVIDRVFQVARWCPQHTFLICTKRPMLMVDELMRMKYIIMCGLTLPEPIPPNLQLGVTIEHEHTGDRFNHLRACPSAVRWVSAEPLLGPLRLDMVRFDWIVIGCETGKNRRPCRLGWVESLIEQAEGWGLPVWVKQLSIDGRVTHDMAEWPEWARRRELPKAKEES